MNPHRNPAPASRRRQAPSPLARIATVVAMASFAAPAIQAELLWSVGMDDNGWPAGDGGGEFTSFVQETGTNALPGNPFSPELDAQADDDYYFAGDYSIVIPNNGEYEPVGTVEFNEEAAERAFAGTDNDLRYHFNLPSTLQQTDLLAVTFDILNLDETPAVENRRYGIEVYFNGHLIQPEILIRPPQFNIDYSTTQFTLASVDAQVGPGADNIVTLKGISKNSEGGGNWMGIDYVKLDKVEFVIPPAVFPWAVGLDDDGWPTGGNGGGANTTFVASNGATNPLPGDPASPEVDGQADNDYYFAGSYTSAIAGNGVYDPVGLVATNEEAAERSLSATETELRYHCNLPNTLTPSSLIAVTFDALQLEAGGTDPRYGVEVLFNGVLVQPEIVIRPSQLGKDFVTPQFSLASVNALIGSGFDNIVTLRGIDYSASGGSPSISFDFLQLNPVTTPVPAPTLPWAVGQNDNGWPPGDGGGANATFVDGNGATNGLPGSPTSTEVAGGADNDYYFAGVYSSLLTGNPVYDPVGVVVANEEAAERGFSAGETEQRYHFNLPAGLPGDYRVSVSIDPLNLATGVADPRHGLEVYVNGVLVQPEIIIRPAQLGQLITTPTFTLASVNARVGAGFDNILTLKGISYAASGGGDVLGLDFVQFNPLPASTFPWMIGMNDNTAPGGNGGEQFASFVQEAGVNAPPGNPSSPEVDQQADDDYYLAGVYANTIGSVTDMLGAYDPVGVVLLNEEAAERAFAGADNDLRYHFNLPDGLLPTDQLAITFDALSLDTSPANTEPRYGVEVYFNEVLVREEILIGLPELHKLYVTEPFTLASVNAQVGSGYDNIVRLKGINYSADGGGAWMGIDFVALSKVQSSPFPWTVGLDDDAWPVGRGGGANTNFVQENGTISGLPGNPLSPPVNVQADNDYYFAGTYTRAIEANGVYDPIGFVPTNEDVAERAFGGGDNEMRYHFNLPSSLRPTDTLTVTFDALNLDTTATNTDPRYGVEVYFNGVLVGPETLIRQAELGVDYTTAPFTLASVGAEVGPGADNIVSLRGINYNADGGGNWMGIDYVALNGTASEEFLPPQITVANGQATLTWSGPGNLEWSSNLVPPWNPFTPSPTSPYTEALQPSGVRYYRLRRP
jgi:hypothetical protein